MKPEIQDRAIRHAHLLLRDGYTIRQVSKETGISRSTVCNDLLKLHEVDIDLYQEVRKKIEYNISVRHKHGGEALAAKRRKELAEGMENGKESR